MSPSSSNISMVLALDKLLLVFLGGEVFVVWFGDFFVVVFCLIGFLDMFKKEPENKNLYISSFFILKKKSQVIIILKFLRKL